ncbi:HNH endonuclease [halophilic archaeon DL31]|jgi:hypothetical protein|nr:HNH endonuclease [halophilic archaeon DL31]
MSRERPPRSKVEKVKERDNYRCQNCGQGRGGANDIEIHAHHIVPLKNGGSNKISNLQTLCEDCHDAVHTDRMAPTAKSTSEGGTAGDEALRALAFVIVANRRLVIYALLLIAGVEIIVGGSNRYPHCDSNRGSCDSLCFGIPSFSRGQASTSAVTIPTTGMF